MITVAGTATRVFRKWRQRVALACLALGLVLVYPAHRVYQAASIRAHLICPPATILVRDRVGEFLGEVPFSEDGIGYWRVDETPYRVATAIAAIEDRRFAYHPGVDPVAIGRAIWQNATNRRRISGASTIAMQVARMQSPASRSYRNKILEAATALLLVHRYGREKVLQHYLRITPYGNRVHGIVYAARRYFDKPIADLSWAEIAFLSAIPQSPSRMSPYRHSERARAIRRADRILGLLDEEQVITTAELALARKQLTRMRPLPRPRRSLDALHAAIRFEGMLRKRAARGELPDPPMVTATLDLDLQESVAALAFEAVENWQAKGAGNAAIMIIDRATAEVRAAVGSTGYYDEVYAGSIDYSRTPRSAGSTLKPFLFAHALGTGLISPASILDDLDRGPTGIENSDRRFLGPLLPRVALANSRNVPAALLVDRIGVDEAYGLLGDLGLHRHDEDASRYGLGLALGTLPVTLEHLVRAYTALASDGLLRDIVWFPGSEAAPRRRVVSEDSARIVSRWLADPMARLPTFPRLGSTEYAFPVAVKTGTSSGYRDSWTIAYTARHVVGVWVGHPSHRPMNGLSGYRGAATLAHRVLDHLYDDKNTDDMRFPPPRGFRAVTLCAVSGQLAIEACDRQQREWMATEAHPTTRCQVHVKRAVDKRSGQLATLETPIETIEVRTFVELPPRYANWMISTGVTRASTPNPIAASSTTNAAVKKPTLRITSPVDGARLLRDPELPPALATVALRAIVNPPSEQVTWYVNGEPLEVVAYPYTARWSLRPGLHTFRVRLPFTEAMSDPVQVLIQ